MLRTWGGQLQCSPCVPIRMTLNSARKRSKSTASAKARQFTAAFCQTPPSRFDIMETSEVHPVPSHATRESENAFQREDFEASNSNNDAPEQPLRYKSQQKERESQQINIE
jgi:hypothetical protein